MTSPKFDLSARDIHSVYSMQAPKPAPARSRKEAEADAKKAAPKRKAAAKKPASDTES